MSVNIKDKLVNDVQSPLRNMDIRQIKLEKAFKELEAFLTMESTIEEIEEKILHQFSQSASKEISLYLGDISDELANVYTLVEQLMKNNKLFALEMAEPAPESLGQRFRNYIGGKKESKFTRIQNPLSINIDLIEEARALPKMWETYLFHMRRRFIMEAALWMDIPMQLNNLMLENDYLFGIVKPRMQKLFMAARQIIEEKTTKTEASILTREVSDEMKMMPFGAPAAPAPKQETAPAK